MASKIFSLVFIQMVVFNMAYGQLLNRLIAPGGCGCGCSNILPIPEQLPTYLQAGPKYLPAGQTYLPGRPCGNVVYDQPTTIIQDSSVANNLANALQLLVVSNLLSSTLPLDGPAPLLAPVELTAPLAPLSNLAPLANLAPYPPCGCGCGGRGCGNCGPIGPYTIVY